MKGASRELSDAGGGRRCAGRDGVQGKRLASGVRADGDAVVDGGAEELLESVGGFEVKGGGLGVAEQQSLLLEGAGDAGGDGVEQAARQGHRGSPVQRRNRTHRGQQSRRMNNPTYTRFDNSSGATRLP